MEICLLFATESMFFPLSRLLRCLVLHSLFFSSHSVSESLCDLFSPPFETAFSLISFPGCRCPERERERERENRTEQNSGS